jgi:hypothetical protein
MFWPMRRQSLELGGIDGDDRRLTGWLTVFGSKCCARSGSEPSRRSFKGKGASGSGNPPVRDSLGQP